MARVQLALSVTDVEAATAFYSKLFDTSPAKVRPGYANFAIIDPPLKLVLIQDDTKGPGSLNHLGVEVDNSEAVSTAASRLAAEGLETAIERDVICCYAAQDKVWVHGPDDEPWEIYTVLADSGEGDDADESARVGGEGCCCPSRNTAPTSGAGAIC